MTSKLIPVSVLLALGTTVAVADDCSPVPDNLVSGCGFDVAGDIASWLPLPPQPPPVVSWNEDGNPGGAMGLTIDPLESWFIVQSECVEVTTPGIYCVAADFREAADYAQTWTCRPQIRRYSDTSCTTPAGMTDPPARVVNHTGWTTASLEGVTVNTGASARVSLYCLRNGIGTGATIRVDNAILRNAPTLDGVAPTVTALATAESAIAGCTTLRAEADAIDVTFSESVLATDPGDPGSAINPANYRLVTPAPGADFDTTDCVGGTGGDAVVAIDGVSWDGPSSAVTLALNGAEPLTDGLYRLLVCGSIEDQAGNALDGGTGMGSDHLRTFRMDRGNLFADGHFDRYDPSCGLSGWTSSTPGDVELAEPDAETSPLSGSAHNTSPSAPAFDLAQCVPAAAGSYRLRGAMRVDEADGLPIEFQLACELYDAVACGGSSLGIWSDAVDLTDTGLVWIGLDLVVDSPVAATSARCGAAISSDSAFAVDVFVDQLRFELIDLFSDGFEGGDTSAWSLAIP